MPYKNRSTTLTDVVAVGSDTVTYVGSAEFNPDQKDLAYHTAQDNWQILKITKNSAGAIISMEYPQGLTAGNPNNLTPAFTAEYIFVRDDRLTYTYG